MSGMVVGLAIALLAVCGCLVAAASFIAGKAIRTAQRAEDDAFQCYRAKVACQREAERAERALAAFQEAMGAPSCRLPPLVASETDRLSA